MNINLPIKKAVLLVIITIQTALVYSQVSVQSDTPLSPAGKWEGKLQLPTASLRIFIQIEETAPGKFRASLASPDQGANNIPVESVNWRNDSLFLDVKAVNGTYTAKLSADKKQFDGVWKQGPAALPLVVQRVETLEFSKKRPQDPQKPYPYREEEVQYENKTAAVSLGATLTLPQGKGPFPVVVLISGSGPQNRDSEIMGHKPFLVMADYLTRLGIAVLRVDDRGVGKSTGDAGTATSADNAGDVTASLNYLKSRADIDKKKIGLIGHSEGGMIAPVVASQSKDLAFVVLLAGVGLPGDQLHRRQMEDIMRMGQVSEGDIQKMLSLNEKLYAVIKAEKGTVIIEDKLTEVVKATAPADAAGMAQFVKALSQPWLRYFIGFNPAPYLEKVNCPVLALNGSKDIQVAAKENLAAIEKALKQGGNKKVTVKEIPGLNHLFQTSKTGSVLEYSSIDETFSPVALKIIGDWIAEIVKL
ncbi:MAG: alpha/beta fold hydrolase [Sphingobacteriaceae bacterium]|nr:alpha/beta fold hydrolase [Sphingobacteriaceae bacterium]